jgi:transcriptional regulator with GAF, ATPase, and Fis domain
MTRGTISAESAPQSAAQRPLGQLQRLIYQCLDLRQLLTALAAELPAFLPVRDRISIAFLEPDGEWLRVHRLLPPPEPSRDSLPRVRVEGTPVGLVVRDGVGRVVSDTRADPNITFGQASHDGIRSTISVPIEVDGRVVGAMNAGSRTPGVCDAGMLQQLAAIAAVVGPALLAAEAAAQPVRRQEDVDRPAGLIGESAAFRALLAAARRAARSDADVLITGETGVGKTALARAMHHWSARRDGPFVTVHLADLTPTLIESELFGHERGAFTGASNGRIGRFESAQGGTIFLDEVSETPLAIQAKLLRVIQDRAFERVGSGRTMQANVRIIAATSHDLRAAIQRGDFREDLFYRLNVVPLSVPALRERPEDLELLVGSILAGIADSASRRLAPEAWARMRAYGWPGNIRELESVLRRAAILEEGPELVLEGFPDRAGGCAHETQTADDAERWPSLDEHERRYLGRVLEKTGGVIEGPTGAAQLLGLHPSTLRSLMKRLGVSAQPARQRGRR